MGQTSHQAWLCRGGRAEGPAPAALLPWQWAGGDELAAGQGAQNHGQDREGWCGLGHSDIYAGSAHGALHLQKPSDTGGELHICLCERCLSLSLYACERVWSLAAVMQFSTNLETLDDSFSIPPLNSFLQFSIPPPPAVSLLFSLSLPQTRWMPLSGPWWMTCWCVRGSPALCPAWWQTQLSSTWACTPVTAGPCPRSSATAPVPRGVSSLPTLARSRRAVMSVRETLEGPPWSPASTSLKSGQVSHLSFYRRKPSEILVVIATSRKLCPVKKEWEKQFPQMWVRNEVHGHKRGHFWVDLLGLARNLIDFLEW